VTTLDLFVFTVDPAFARDVVLAGATGLVVDWEVRGKHRRQAGADTEVNAHTPLDLARVRAATAGRVLCRLNAVGPWTPDEVERAVDLGADEVLLPMVRRPEQVDRALDLVAGRVGVGILVETAEAVQRVDELVARPLSRVYVGPERPDDRPRPVRRLRAARRRHGGGPAPAGARAVRRRGADGPRGRAPRAEPPARRRAGTARRLVHLPAPLLPRRRRRP
jgi:hypothetical protein